MALGLVNDNKVAVDRFLFEQMAWAPVTGIAGTCLCDDEERFIYVWFQTSATAATFARYDTFGDAWQLLATPATVTGTVNSIVFSKTVGSQLSGQVNGSIYLFNGNGTTCYFYKYDIGTNVWSTNLGTTNVPATFGTDANLCYPAPSKNNYETTYHSGVTRTITTTAAAAAGATTISVASLPEALASGTILRFNAYDVTISAAAAKGAVTLTVTGNIEAMKAGTVFRTKDGREFCLSQDSLASAGTLNIHPLQRDILAGSKFSCEKFAVLTAAAALNATSLTVSALRVGIPNASTAPYYGNMYLIGNNSTVMYRYNIGGNAWSTTSANSANPAIPAVTGACGAGCALKFLPAYSPNLLYIIRGTGTSNIYTYDLVNNTFAALTYYPSSETFTTGSNTAVKSVGGKQASLIIQKDVSNRFFEFVPYKNRLEPKLTQQQYPQGAAVVGDKISILTSPDGIDYLYVLLNSSTSFNRCPLVDS